MPPCLEKKKSIYHKGTLFKIYTMEFPASKGKEINFIGQITQNAITWKNCLVLWTYKITFPNLIITDSFKTFLIQPNVHLHMASGV